MTNDIFVLWPRFKFVLNMRLFVLAAQLANEILVAGLLKVDPSVHTVQHSTQLFHTWKKGGEKKKEQWGKRENMGTKVVRKTKKGKIGQKGEKLERKEKGMGKERKNGKCEYIAGN